MWLFLGSFLYSNIHQVFLCSINNLHTAVLVGFMGGKKKKTKTKKNKKKKKKKTTFAGYLMPNPFLYE